MTKPKHAKMDVRQSVNFGLKLNGYTQIQRAQALGMCRATIQQWDKIAEDVGAEVMSVEMAHKMVESMVPAAAGVVAGKLKKKDYTAARDVLQTHKVLRDRKEMTLATVPDSDIESELADIAARSSKGGGTVDGAETPPD